MDDSLAQLLGVLVRLLGGRLQRSRALLAALDCGLELNVCANFVRLQVIVGARFGLDLSKQRLDELDGGLGQERVDGRLGDGIRRGQVANVDDCCRHGECWITESLCASPSLGGRQMGSTGRKDKGASGWMQRQ